MILELVVLVYLLKALISNSKTVKWLRCTQLKIENIALQCCSLLIAPVAAASGGGSGGGGMERATGPMPGSRHGCPSLIRHAESTKSGALWHTSNSLCFAS